MAKIFIECGTSLTSPFNTGIQRVVRSIVRESEVVGQLLGHECIPVTFMGSYFNVNSISETQKPGTKDGSSSFFVLMKITLHQLIVLIDRKLENFIPGKFYQLIRRNIAPYVRVLFMQYSKNIPVLKIQDVMSMERYSKLQQPIASVQPILLLLDSTWDMKMWKAVDEFRTAGGRVCAVLYDLIPFTHPDTVEENTRKAHTDWWTEAPLHIDSVTCISQTVRQQFLIWQQEKQLARQIADQNVTYFYLGSELNMDDEGFQLSNILINKKPYFLVVGSIEPRKNHAVILNAFELIWQQGHEINLVIVGSHGWKSEELTARIKNHAEFKKQLFLLKKTTDAELNLLYTKTTALIIASVAEGFGLPIVESLQRGTKVICSDIPVFREIAGNDATFFDMKSPAALANIVCKSTEQMPAQAVQKNNDVLKWITWKESAQQLLTKVVTSTSNPANR